jgi:hypothetical protein
VTAPRSGRSAPAPPLTGAGLNGSPAEGEPRGGLSVDELDVIVRVRDALRRVRFGTVLLVVQDGKVVQIETAEKIRL